MDNITADLLVLIGFRRGSILLAISWLLEICLNCKMWKSSRYNRTRAVFGDLLSSDSSTPTTVRPKIPALPVEHTTVAIEQEVMHLNSVASVSPPLSAGYFSIYVAASVIVLVHLWSFFNLGLLGVWVRRLVGGLCSVAARLEEGPETQGQPQEPSVLWLASELSQLQHQHSELDKKVESLIGSFQEMSQVVTRLERKIDGQRDALTGVKADFILKLSAIENGVRLCRTAVELVDRNNGDFQNWMSQEFEVSKGFKNVCWFNCWFF